MSPVTASNGELNHGRRHTVREMVEIFTELYSNNKYGKIDNPIRFIALHELEDYLKPVHDLCKHAVTMPELVRGAKLARMEHELDLGQKLDFLEPAERQALKIQRSSKFWKEPKDLLMTMVVCCLASAVMGWDQMANGNFGWPRALGVPINTDENKIKNLPIFAAVQATPWFSAAILGSWLSDPLSEYIGRRTALFVAGLCSLVGSIAGSQARTWKMLIGTRVVLGLGIGGKASIVPVLESEVLPSSKRGRLLVSWQAFTAAGLFAGSVASYIFRHDWRSQYLSGALPALVLLATTFMSCESPRWLIIQNEYEKAFVTLVRLRKERVLAAKELASIHYQIQAERGVFLQPNTAGDDAGFNRFQLNMGRSSYRQRLYNMFMFPRIRRAAISATIVMLSQQMSGINIFAFLAAQFYSAIAPLNESNHPKADSDSYKIAIGFGATNMLFSILAYLLVENKDPAQQRPIFRAGGNQSSDDERRESPTPVQQPRIRQAEHPIQADHRPHLPSPAASEYSADEAGQIRTDNRQRFRGRRFLLLTSLGAGAVILLLTASMFTIKDKYIQTKRGLIVFFTILFTAFYSPGAGAIPFLYCAEIFPNEGRELYMSWSTFVNFFSAGCLAFGVPFGFNRNNVATLLGIFAVFNAIAFILVFLFVPGTNQTATLEDMSCVFGRPMRDHMDSQLKRIKTRGKDLGPRLAWLVAEDDEDFLQRTSNSHENERQTESYEMTEQFGSRQH